MKFTEVFQKAYYINLDRRTDRKEEFENEMKSAGLDGFFERVSAEDSINESEWNRKHFYCAASYYKLFEKIYEEGHETFLIFEDDAQFYNGGDIPGLALAELALEELQQFPDWEMIYFGGYPQETMKLVSPHLSRINNILTTHAIGYKRSVLEIVLGYTKLTRRYIPFEDGAIDSWFGARNYFKSYLVNPISIIQRHSTSDLDAFGYKATIHGFLESYKVAPKVKVY